MDAIEPAILNKVKASKLVTIDLQAMIEKEKIMELDLSEWLHMGLVLREKTFREHIESEDWTRFKGAYVWIHCGTDAIIPTWAWMLAGLRLKGLADFVHVGGKEEFLHALLLWKLRHHDWSMYRNKYVIVKGCSDMSIPESCYALTAMELSSFAKKILYGEACSNVPLHNA